MFCIINIALIYMQIKTVETNYHFPLCFCFLLHWEHFTPLTHGGRFIHSNLDASSVNRFTRVGHPGVPLQSQRDGSHCQGNSIQPKADVYNTSDESCSKRACFSLLTKWTAENTGSDVDIYSAKSCRLILRPEASPRCC